MDIHHFSTLHVTPLLQPTRAVGPAPDADARAVVFGGGGATGNAWLIGVAAGLFEAGIDVTAADLTIGTSAGATAAAQLTGATPTDLLAAVLDGPPPAPPVGTGGGPAPRVPVTDHLERTNAIIAAAGDPTDMRRRMGAAALELEAASDGSWSQRWRATVAGRLPGPVWPRRTIFLTAVDADTGQPVVFDRASGVDLVDAVAASCSSGLPYRIGGSWYLDGGYRRNENADLAAGHARVLVLSPFGGRSRHPSQWGMQLAAQVDELTAGGSRVETIVPQVDAEHLFGVNSTDLLSRPAAARAGHQDGSAAALRLTGFWR